MTKVGILGGTFDPPHVAHAAMAGAARDRLGLDRMLLMPASEPPHKTADELSPYSHRVAMVELDAAALDGVEVSRFEERRTGPSYTVDLLRDFAAGDGSELYFVLGSDSLGELGSWRDPEGILSLCTLVVFIRPGYPARLDVRAPASVVVFEQPVIEVSSTDVRARIRRGESVSELVSEPVLSYIQEHGLYR